MFHLLYLLPLVSSHVSLLFPSARYPPLDFLDSLRTKGPCGVPRPIKRDSLNTLITGREYNITWRMSYPHQGGYRLTLLDSQGERINQLVPSIDSQFTGKEDDTMTTISFDSPCHNCTLLLQRQAIEWGKSYVFHSCSDVNIVANDTQETICNANGRMKDNQCQCDAGYGGMECRDIVDCQDDSECGSGRCVREEGSLITQSCFCPYGLFGRNCESQFTGKPDNDCFAYEKIRNGEYNKYAMFNGDCYERKEVSHGDIIHYRHIKDEDEVEVILDFNTTSWVGIGWRPEGLDPSCRLFPDLEGARYKRSSPSVQMPPLRVHSTEVESFGEPSSPRQSISTPHHIEQEGPIPVMPKSNGLLESALRAPLHAMDCMDMIVGGVRDGRSRIQDMYSRDRSTPLQDHWYDGTHSLTAAYAIQVDGRTIVMFRRPRQEIEPTDHPLGGNNQFVIWAKGQTKGMYSHSTPSAAEHSMKEFYPDDILNYHGATNRGILKVNLAADVIVQKGMNRQREESTTKGITPSTQRIDDSLPLVTSTSSSLLISSILSIILLRVIH